MREILFRGKRIDNGEWVEGYYRGEKVGEYLTAAFVIEPLTSGVWERHRVDPETVGQYINQLDNNGAKIFEGDILRYYDDEIQVVEWSDDWSQIMLHTYGEHERKVGRKTVKEKFEGWNYLHDYPLEDMPILGNIHDNPELLGGANK